MAGMACVPSSEMRPPLVSAARPWWSAAAGAGHLEHDVDAVAVRLGAQPAGDVVAGVEHQVRAHQAGHLAAAPG